ncbi:MAG TPA: aspartyl-phosphate phosphatase Spo0E family protein [Bacillus sp. (in: firmicutes)]|uniref:aspartyl-phosphate phosphatase Spo0E family protein n=1 Tax=Bacillus litorisediminis TaxID=2922713 RepID=UPI001FAD97B0|nr:aspartyl-phosphate phosphatase Spo0E family protein [Bacillus litorisediminis]HWO76163.1 aspartyl-phosphate phosphatase Spo0E family protein [Bacillus sp. (in: firmicutes)]
MERDDVTVVIDALRQKLIATADQKGLQSPDTLQISRELDRVLNNLMNKNKN